MCAYDLFSLHSSRLRYEFTRNKSDKYIYGVYIMIAYSIIDKKKEGGRERENGEGNGQRRTDEERSDRERERKSKVRTPGLECTMYS